MCITCRVISVPSVITVTTVSTYNSCRLVKGKVRSLRRASYWSISGPMCTKLAQHTLCNAKWITRCCYSAHNQVHLLGFWGDWEDYVHVDRLHHSCLHRYWDGVGGSHPSGQTFHQDRCTRQAWPSNEWTCRSLQETGACKGLYVWFALIGGTSISKMDLHVFCILCCFKFR